jgi:hypothetical protein
MIQRKKPIFQLTYDQGVSDCWSYLYYDLGMKDLADQMFEHVSNLQEDDSDD